MKNTTKGAVPGDLGRVKRRQRPLVEEPNTAAAPQPQPQHKEEAQGPSSPGKALPSAATAAPSSNVGDGLQLSPVPRCTKGGTKSE